MELIAWIIGALVSVVVAYWIIRLAVRHALRDAAIWTAGGGVQKAQDDEEFRRTGLRPNRDE